MLKLDFIFLMFLLALQLPLQGRNVTDPRPVKHVLVLISYDMGHKWTRELVDTVREKNENLPVRMIYTILKLDALRTRDHQAWSREFRSSLENIQAGKYGMILAVDDMAVQLVMEHYHELPQGLPVVFAGYETCPPDLKQQYPNMTGVVQNYGTEETIRIALALYPKTTEFVILSDSSPTSREFEQRARALNLSRPGVKFTFLDNGKLEASKLFARLKALPDDSLVLLSPWRGLLDNDYQSLPAFGLDLADMLPHPYLISVDTMMGYGALGGVLTDAVEHGTQTAEVIADVIRRGSAEYIPVQQGKLKPIFDYTQLTAENLDLSKLPPGTIFRNTPPSFWEKHGEHLLWFFGASALMLLMFAAYVITVRKTTKKSMRILESLPGRVGVLNPEEKILFMNGDCSSAADDATCLKEIPNIDYEKVSEAMKNVFRTGKPLAMEYEYNLVKRSISIAPLARDIFGQETVIWFSHDNQELQNTRKQAEAIAAQLKRQTHLWDLLINLLPVHIFAKDPDREFQYVFCNRAMQEYCGFPEADLVGKQDSDLFPESVCRRMEEEDRHVMTLTEESFGSVIRTTGKDGVLHDFHFMKRAFCEEDGSRLLLGVAIDVTELEKTKRELNDTLAQHHLLLDNMPGFVFTMDMDNEFRYTSCNRAVLNMWGMSEKEALGKNDLEIFGGKTGELLMKNNREMKPSEEFTERIIPYTVPATGESRIAHLSMKTLDLSDNRHLLFGFGVDITEQEKLKAELQDTAAVFRLIMDHIPSCIVAKDIQNDFVYTLCNQYFCRMTGRKEEQILGHRNSDIFTSSEEVAFFRKRELEALQKDAPVESLMSFTGEDGSHLTHAHWIPLNLSGGRRWLFLFIDDITDLEKARNEAAENAEWFKLTLNSIGDGVLTTDINGRIVLLNPIAEQMLGVRLAEIAGEPHEKYFHIVSAGDESPMNSPIARSLRTGATVELANHTVLISRNGKRYHISDSAAPIRDRNGKMIGAILVFRDVTEEQENRDMLRAALTRLEETSQLTRSASFRLDPATREISGTTLLAELMPIGDGRLVPWEEWVNPDDLASLRKELTLLYSRAKDWIELHFRAVFHEELRYYRIQIRLERRNNRKFLCGAVQDVTEITRNAGALKSSQELWDQVINAIPILFFAKDVQNDCRFILCNRAFAAHLGKTPEEIIGRNEKELNFSAEEIAEDLRMDEQCLRGMCEIRYEKNACGGNDVIRRMQIVKRPFTGTDGRQMILGTANDITELSNLIASERVNSEILSKVVRQSDFNKVLNEIADTLKRQIQCDRVMIAKCNDDGLLRFYREWVSENMPSIRESGIENHYRLWDKYIDRMRNHESLKIPMLEHHEITRSLEIKGHYKTVSLMITPIFVDGVLWGALFSSYARRRDFSAVDERLMSSCANIISLAEIRERQTQDIQKANFEKQMILNNIRIPVWLHDGSGELVRVNTAVETLAGIPASELTTERNWKIFSANLPENILRPVYEVIQTGKSVRRELSYGKRDYIVNAEPVKDDAGNIVYIVKSAVDVTDLNSLIRTQQVTNFCLETLLRESNPMQAVQLALRAASEFMHAARSVIIRLDRVHKTVTAFSEYAGDGQEHIFDEVIDYPYTSKPNWEERFQNREYWIYPDLMADSIGLGNDWIRVIRKHQIHALYTNRILCGDGLWGYVGFLFEEKRNEFDEYEIKFLRAFAHFIEFILERKSAQEQIMSALQKAQAADKAKSFFIASVSHEIRTPLNSVIGFSELLRETDVSPEEQKTYIDAIAYSGNALLQLVNDVLDLSKLEADQMAFLLEPCDFSVLAQEVMNVFRHRGTEKKLCLSVSAPDLPKLKLDKVRIRQILFNLLGNAVKFTERGSITLSAEFLPESGGTGTLKFKVSDTGIGIADNDIRRLMEPFVQLSKMRGTNAANNGTGLGLSICKRLVEKMNGQIWVESKLGAGSTFGVELSHIECCGASAVPDKKEEENDSPLSPQQSSFSVLLVDDVDMNRKVLEAMCRKLGISRIGTVSSGSEAFAWLESHSADLILTDMWMPGMSGAELAEKLHGDPRFAAIPVFAVTADMEANENFVMNLFSGVVLKPVTLEKIRRVLDSVAKPEETASHSLQSMI